MSDLTHFKTASDAGRWIVAQGYVGLQGVLSLEMARKEIGKLKKDPRNGYPFQIVKKLADKTWGGKADEEIADIITLPAGNLLDAKERYLNAQAEEKEWKLKQLQGQLIDVAEEERRDVLVLLGIRRHLETAVPDRAISMLAKIKTLIPEEQHGIINAHLPEIIEADREVIADMFDSLAKQGGVNESI